MSRAPRMTQGEYDAHRDRVRGYPELKSSTARVADRAEAVLQDQAETWMRLRGYAPMHADQAGATPRGWYAHLRRPDRVPEMQIADLLILSADMRRCVQIDYTTPNGTKTRGRSREVRDCRKSPAIHLRPTGRPSSGNARRETRPKHRHPPSSLRAPFPTGGR
jgi:hypothetical protein